MALEFHRPDLNDPTYLNQVYVEAGDVLPTREGDIALGDCIGAGSGGKVFEVEDAADLVVKVIRRYRVERTIAKLLMERPAPGTIPILAVRSASEYCAIMMPRADQLGEEDLAGVDLDALYRPMEEHLARLGYRYCDGRCARNLVRYEARLTVIDFSHARRLRWHELRA